MMGTGLLAAEGGEQILTNREFCVSMKPDWPGKLELAIMLLALTAKSARNSLNTQYPRATAENFCGLEYHTLVSCYNIISNGLVELLVRIETAKGIAFGLTFEGG
jgi:hypothetical protein